MQIISFVVRLFLFLFCFFGMFSVSLVLSVDNLYSGFRRVLFKYDVSVVVAATPHRYHHPNSRHHQRLQWIHFRLHASLFFWGGGNWNNKKIDYRFIASSVLFCVSTPINVPRVYFKNAFVDAVVVVVAAAVTIHVSHSRMLETFFSLLSPSSMLCNVCFEREPARCT